MSTSALNRWSALLGTVGATGIGLFQVKEGIDSSYRLPVQLWTATLWGSLGLLALAAALFLLARVRIDLSRTIYTCLGVSRAQIPAYYRFIQKTLGEDIASMARVYEWFDKNPNVLRAVFRENSRGLSLRRELIGFFTVFPVTTDCARLLAQNQIKGTGLGADQIVSGSRRPAALYIGAVGAPGWRARQQTMLALMGYLSPWLDRRMSIYTRPTTERGRAAAVKHHFVAIDSSAPLGESIYVRNSQT